MNRRQPSGQSYGSRYGRRYRRRVREIFRRTWNHHRRSIRPLGPHIPARPRPLVVPSDPLRLLLACTRPDWRAVNSQERTVRYRNSHRPRGLRLPGALRRISVRSLSRHRKIPFRRNGHTRHLAPRPGLRFTARTEPNIHRIRHTNGPH